MVPMVVVERHGTNLDVFTLLIFQEEPNYLLFHRTFYSLDTKSIKVLPEQQLLLNGPKESMHY